MRIMKEKYLSQSSVVLRMQKNNVDFPAYCSVLLHGKSCRTSRTFYQRPC